jgi:hypothetical protein
LEIEHLEPRKLLADLQLVSATELVATAVAGSVTESQRGNPPPGAADYWFAADASFDYALPDTVPPKLILSSDLALVRLQGLNSPEASIWLTNRSDGEVQGDGVSGSIGPGELTFEVVPSRGEPDNGQMVQITMGSSAGCDMPSASGSCTLTASYDAGPGNAGSLSCSATPNTLSAVDVPRFQVPLHTLIHINFGFSSQEVFYTTSQKDQEGAGGFISLMVKSLTASPTLVTTASPAAVTLDSGVAPTLTDSAVLSYGNSETGTITFTLTGPDGVTVLDTESRTVHGDDTYSTPDGYRLPATAIPGTYTWSARYSGDGNNKPAYDQGDSAEQTVVTVTPTLVTTASPTTAALDGSIPTILTDTAALSGGYNPTGMITFTLTGPSGIVLESEPVSVDSGNSTYTASYTLPTTVAGAGTYTWSARYGGDPDNNPANDQGGADEQTVIDKVTPTLVSTASPAVIALDGSGLQVLTDSAELSGGYDEGGTIAFTLFSPGGVSILEESVGVNGDRTYSPLYGFPLPVTGEIAGTYTWQAVYSGDPNNNGVGDQGGPAEQTVVTQSATTTTLTSSTDPFGSHYGESVTFTATVSAVSPAVGPPTGEVDFFSDGSFLGSGTLSAGVATFTTDALHAGDHTITAHYVGDGNFSPSDSNTYVQSVAKANTDIIGRFGDRSVYGQKLTIIPIITVFPGAPTLPTGSLLLYEDPKLAPIDAQALPTGAVGLDLSRSDLTAGTHTLTVVYSGDDDFKSYGFSYGVTVARSPLTVTANNQDMAHGDPLPRLTWTFTGFVNGDTAAVVSGSPVLSTEVSPRSSAGHYTITIAVGSLAAANYFFPNLVPGTLTVHPKVVDVRVDYGNKSMSLIGLKRDLPFATIKAIDVIFSDNVNVSLGNLSLAGANVSRYGLSSVSYDPTTDDATWTFPSAIGVDKLMLALDGASYAADPTISVRHFGTKFAVLPGDINGDGIVNVQDLILERNAIQGTGDPSLIGWADINGDGVPDLSGFYALRKRLGTRIPS